MNFAKRIDWIRDNLNKSVRLQKNLLTEIPVTKEKVRAQEKVVDELSDELRLFYRTNLADTWGPFVEALENEELKQDNLLSDLELNLENLESDLDHLESSIESASYDASEAAAAADVVLN